MGKSLDEKLKGLSKERQKSIEARAQQLILEEMTIQDMRKALSLTQKALAKSMNISQDNISRLESRSDMLLSTLTKLVKSLGGELSLIAEFPERPAVKLSGFSDFSSQEPKKAPSQKPKMAPRINAPYRRRLLRKAS